MRDNRRSYERNNLDALKTFIRDYERYQDETNYYDDLKYDVSEFEFFNFRIPVPKPFRFFLGRKQVQSPNEYMYASINLDKEDLEYLYNKYKKQHDEMSIGEKRKEKETLRKNLIETQKKLAEVTTFLNENDPYELKKNK